MSKLKSKISNFPTKPGVYLFKDKAGKILYVGKAKNLKSRVSQYFGKSDTRAQLPFLLEEATSIDYTVVASELESLFLENTLIKEYLPPFNIKLRDDKNYAFITIDYSTEIPSINYVRKIEDQTSPNLSSLRRGTKYFGPYSSTKKIRQTLDLVRKVFPFCSNTQVGKHPCFYYFLHRCQGVCIGKISIQEYLAQIERISLFLSGKTDLITRELKTDMVRASKQKKFERAGRLRDALQALEILSERQTAIFSQKVNWDFMSVYISGPNACINLFKVRGGKLIDKENFIYDATGQIDDKILEKQTLQTALENYYAVATNYPKEIYIQTSIENQNLIQSLLKNKSGKKISIQVPTRGPKLKLINLGITNGKEFLQKWQLTQGDNLDLLREALQNLQTILKLPTLPRRIEGYDISNIQGTNPVSSMVVAINGQPAKSEYRKFKITSKNTPDDFAMVEETLTRRLLRLEETLPTDKLKEAWPTPDLIVIDGGKGQLGVAVKVLKQKKLKIPVIGLAKRIEEIFVPGKSKPIILSHDNPSLQLLQRLRDEAHRFGITFHRSLRSKQAVKSKLDEIAGVGPKTKKILKQKFGTVSNIRMASIDELANAIGQTKALQIKKEL